jgi:hypothetical protein
MAAALPFLAIAGTVMSAVGAIQQGNAAKKAADYNAAIADRNATIATQQAAADANTSRSVNARRLGAMRAKYGSSGVQAEGSVLDVMADSAAQAELEALNITYKGDLAAQGYGETATLNRMQGKNARTSGYLNAGSALLLGGAKASGGSTNSGYSDFVSGYNSRNYG